MERALDAGQSRGFLGAFLPFQERVAELGMRNGLAQLALKLTAPGVPDIYQGADLWDFSLVDPDNRRPVDFDARVRLLGEVLTALCQDRRGTMRRLIENWRDGAIKLAMTATLLNFRREHEALFRDGRYEPVLAEGPAAERVCAFVRRHEGNAVFTAVSPFPGQSGLGWRDTVLKLPEDFQGSQCQDVLTGVVFERGEGAPAAERLFADLPVAVPAAAR